MIASRSLFVLGSLLLLAVAGCEDASGSGILVQIGIDEDIEDVNEIQLLARTDDGFELGWVGWSEEFGNFRRSGEFGLETKGSERAEATILVELLGSGSRNVRFVRAVKANFVPGKIVKVPVEFVPECADVLCCNPVPAADKAGTCLLSTTATPDCRKGMFSPAMCRPAEECRSDGECITGKCTDGLCDGAGDEEDGGDQ